MVVLRSIWDWSTEFNMEDSLTLRKEVETVLCTLHSQL